MTKMTSCRCAACGSHFVTTQSRDDHVNRVHLQNEEENRCPTCFGLYKSAINLKKHFERFHPNTNIPNMNGDFAQNGMKIEVVAKSFVQDEKQLYRSVLKYLHRNLREQTSEVSRYMNENDRLRKRNQELERKLNEMQRKLKARDKDLCNTLRMLHRSIRETKRNLTFIY